MACQIIQFQILNVNDNPPIIDQNGIENQVSVKENQTSGIDTKLLTLTASDVDNLGQLTFSLPDKDQDKYPFSLVVLDNQASLMVNQSLLDYEERIFWSVTIIVEVRFRFTKTSRTVFNCYFLG